MPKTVKRAVKIIRPEREEARDEGPRLIPLDEVKPSDSRLQHCIRLADIALGKGAQKGRSRHER
jgi:hypothetical protein